MGVACGSIIMETHPRHRARVLEPVVVVASDRLSAQVVHPIRSSGRRRRPQADRQRQRCKFKEELAMTHEEPPGVRRAGLRTTRMEAYLAIAVYIIVSFHAFRHRASKSDV